MRTLSPAKFPATGKNTGDFLHSVRLFQITVAAKRLILPGFWFPQPVPRLNRAGNYQGAIREFRRGPDPAKKRTGIIAR
jgi:hypothetical protein